MVPRPGVTPTWASEATSSANSARTAAAMAAPSKIAAPMCPPGLLVLEVPLAREHHGDAVLVSGGDDLFVAQRPPRLHNGGHARLGQLVDVVAEGKEGVA